MFRYTFTPRRILGIGTHDHLRHREAKNERWTNKVKATLLCVGVAGLTSVIYSTYRTVKSYKDPKSTSTALNNKMDSMMLNRPDLAVALLKMMIHHEISDTETPFASPMVAQTTLKDHVEELEDIVSDLVNYTSLTVPDVWDMLCVRAVVSLGGPLLTPMFGRKESLNALKVHYKDPVVNEKKRDILKLKKILSDRGWNNYDIVALIGAYRCCGYHGGVKISYDKDKNKYNSDTPLNEHRKTKLNPFVFDGEYFEGLTTYDWQAVPDSVNRKSMLSLFSYFDKPVVTEFYKCYEDKKAATKALVLERTKKVPTVQINPEKNPEYIAPKELVICHEVTMEGMDMSLLDDPMLVGLVYKYSTDESDFFNSISDIFRKIRLRGHDINEIVQRIE